LFRAAKHAICFGVVYESNATTNTVSGQLAGADQTPHGAFGDIVAFGNSADATTTGTRVFHGLLDPSDIACRSRREHASGMNDRNWAQNVFLQNAPKEDRRKGTNPDVSWRPASHRH
jgi:hypothetical protein